MSVNKMASYDVDRYVTEIYDKTETDIDEVELMRKLIGKQKGLRILEPFCGHGRILIPLVEDGHSLTGIDQSQVMLDVLKERLAKLKLKAEMHRSDATAGDWPTGFDLVVLAGNCFYELATPEEQEACITAAAKALKQGGFVCVDNDHMEGELDERWCEPGIQRGQFPTGTCADGTKLEGTRETIWFDVAKRLWKARCSVTITSPDGTVKCKEWEVQKHPVSTYEVNGWLEKHGFEILHLYGDHAGSPYTDEMSRAFFWARKK